MSIETNVPLMIIKRVIALNNGQTNDWEHATCDLTPLLGKLVPTYQVLLSIAKYLLSAFT